MTNETAEPSFLSKRTAFLVIHGIGEQVKFETVDAFGRGLVEDLRARGIAPELDHRITQRSGPEGAWTESFMRIRFPGHEGYMDVHECFWAHLTEDTASLSEVINWLLLTAWGTRKYYRQNEDLRESYEERRSECGGTARFPIYRLALSILLLYPIMFLVNLFIPKFVKELLSKTIKPLATWALRGYVGDVTVYTTTDEKSKFFAVRSRILATSRALLGALLADDQYERVVVAGHSLGSVIAYDTLNLLNLDINLDASVGRNIGKLHGLVTFGSPLDKIAFFFRERGADAQYVRRGFINGLHAFRAKRLDVNQTPQPIPSTVQRFLEPLPWLNFYDCKDPVSGHLDFYVDVDNRVLEMGEKWGIAHLAYWDHPAFYRTTLNELLAK
jgi:pimeloyl-ACP methyl ester carboxylesterase